MALPNLVLYRRANAPAVRIVLEDVVLTGSTINLDVTPKSGGATTTYSTGGGGLTLSGTNTVIWTYSEDDAAGLPVGDWTSFDLYRIVDDTREKIGAGTVRVNGVGGFEQQAPVFVEVPGIQGPAFAVPEGQWTPRSYPAKSFVTHNGSAWWASVDTDGEPGISADWQIWLDGSGKVPENRRVDVEGLVKGGGDLSQNRQVRVDIATPTEIEGGSADDKAITPAGLAPVLGGIQQASRDYTDGAVATRVTFSDLASTSDPEKGAGGLGYGPSQPYGTDTVGGELNRKRAQAVNVLDHGGSPSATTSVNNSAFQAAYTQAPSGGFIIVPPGNYNLSVIPASTGKVVTWIAYGATINGSVNNWLTIPGMVQASGGGFTTPTVFSMYATENQKPGPLLIRRSVNGSGGTNGYVTPALEVYTTVTGDGENFDWAFLSRLHNSSTGDGQNCAGYFRALRQVEGAAGTWGLCIEAADETAGAAGGQLVGLEIDIDGDGDPGSTSKTAVKRVALDVTARVKNRSGTGIFGRADYGVRIRSNSQGGTNDAGYKYAHLYFGGTTDGVVIDAVDVEGDNQIVLAVKDADRLRLSSSAERDIYYNPTNGALEYSVAGVNLLRVTNSGILRAYGIIDADTELRVSNIKVVGDRSLGWTAMTGTQNKGALAAAAAGTASGSYVQSELQTALNRIAALEARMRAYDGALFAHGLIGA